MRNRNLIVMTLLLGLMVFATACTSLNKVTPEQWDDEAIELEVRGRMAEDMELKAFEIGVDVDKGVVTLDGHVSSLEIKRKAADAADDVEGVRYVINNLHVM